MSAPLDMEKVRASIAARKTAAEVTEAKPKAELVEAVAKIARHCWRATHWERRGKHPTHIKQPLTRKHLEHHLDAGPRVGVAPIVPGTAQTRIALLDLDSHKGELDWDAMAAVGVQLMRALRERGLSPIPFSSTGGNGIHLMMLWDEPQDAYSVRQLLVETLAACDLRNGVKGVKAGEVEIFPKQDRVPLDGAGSMFILPLGGESWPLDDACQRQPFELAEHYGRADQKWPTSKPVAKRDRTQKENDRSQIAYTAENTAPISAGAAEIRQLLEAIPNSDLDYDEWRNIIFAIHDATGGSAEGLALAHEFSSRSSKYDPAFLDERVWPYIRSEGRDSPITIATLRHAARKHEDPTADFEPLPPEDESAPGAEPSDANEKNPFTTIEFNEYADRRAPDWIIVDVLPRADVVIVYGASGSGKSFLVLDMMVSIALGESWCGRRTKKLSVVYIVAEGAGWFRNRLRALREHHGVTPSDLFFIPAAPDLLDKAQVVLLIKALKERAPVGLVVVDTLAQTTPGANENSAEDFGRALKNCRRIANETGATVLLVHHAGKDLDRGARGWSGLKAAADAQLEVRREGDTEARELRLEKLKDAADGGLIPFRLQSVDIGRDADGRSITSCVVTYPDAASTPPITRKKKGGRQAGLGDRELLVLRVAHELMSLGDDSVALEALIDRASLQIEHDPAKRDRRREHTVRAVGSLQEKGLLKVQDDFVRITADGERKASAGAQ